MIEVRDLAYQYDRQSVLQDINITFAAHALTALIGPNGAGKSTLLMQLAGLQQPSQGQILLNQQDIRQIKLADYAKQVATLRQFPGFHLKLQVQELVAFGRFPYSKGHLNAQDHQIIAESLQFLGLSALAEKTLDQLSGGQRQMAFLALVIAQQTPVLLLDEPLNNLDMKHAVQLMRALRRLCDEQGRTVILVIHDINFAASYADYILALKDGRIHFSGTVEETVTEQKLSDLYDLTFSIVQDAQGRLCNYFNPRGE
ncbi:iron ABC transporter ATP-binding protein [Acinetobacter larvae]|uniref:Iron ABC transporter ATP-binding protein n=1 Tax=Acinetobacter larvae TaxID=1789224 RepID=A0A1B2LZA4_9GAMM|nr:ATP-binding cassette domain-containing protein [Acinetobacter larvae]AOA58103.1 iron ABC transporter ATP-binding protein [Acinetobacter larvae]